MAKLIKCKTCGAEISKNAKVCPHCGEPAPAPENGSLLTLLVIGVLIWAYVFIFAVPQTRSTSSSSKATTSVSTVTIPTKTKVEKTEILERAKWSGDTDWYYNKDGDYHGNYLGWYRYSISVPSTNTPETIRFSTGAKKDVFVSLVLDSYKKNKNSKKIKRVLYLEVFGNKKNINKVAIHFDNEAPYTYTMKTKHNIQVHFSKKDIPKIIEKLNQAKTFKIDYTHKTGRFINKNFVESFKVK